MSPEDKEIEQQAITYAKKNKTKLARQLTDKTIYAKERDPVSVFMCGSPGAGKTESSKIFLKEIGSDNVIRLDPDDLRCKFPGYNGANSYLFQRAISVIIERALDYAQELATQWLWLYNNERPNTAIGGIPPKQLTQAVH